MRKFYLALVFFLGASAWAAGNAGFEFETESEPDAAEAAPARAPVIEPASAEVDTVVKPRPKPKISNSKTTQQASIKLSTEKPAKEKPKALGNQCSGGNPATTNTILQSVLGPGRTIDKLKPVRTTMDGDSVGFVVSVDPATNKVKLTILGFAHEKVNIAYYGSDVPVDICRVKGKIVAKLLLKDAVPTTYQFAAQGGLPKKYLKENVTLSLWNEGTDVRFRSADGKYDFPLAVGQ